MSTRVSRVGVRSSLYLGLLAAVACSRGVAPEREKADDLAGFRAPLPPGAPLRLEVQGSVGGRSAKVVFELASPLSTIGAGCYSVVPTSRRTVRLARPGGELEEMPEVQVRTA